MSENCTTHNYNVLALRPQDGKPRCILVAGNYQAGISVVDDGYIYESDITRRLTIWRLDDPAIRGFRQQVFSNPQTQTFSIQ